MYPHSVNVSSQTLSNAEQSEHMHLPGMGLRDLSEPCLFSFQLQQTYKNSRTFDSTGAFLFTADDQRLCSIDLDQICISGLTVCNTAGNNDPVPGLQIQCCDRFFPCAEEQHFR